MTALSDRERLARDLQSADEWPARDDEGAYFSILSVADHLLALGYTLAPRAAVPDEAAYQAWIAAEGRVDCEHFRAWWKNVFGGQERGRWIRAAAGTQDTGHPLPGIVCNKCGARLP